MMQTRYTQLSSLVCLCVCVSTKDRNMSLKSPNFFFILFGFNVCMFYGAFVSKFNVNAKYVSNVWLINGRVMLAFSTFHSLARSYVLAACMLHMCDENSWAKHCECLLNEWQKGKTKRARHVLFIYIYI